MLAFASFVLDRELDIGSRSHVGAVERYSSSEEFGAHAIVSSRNDLRYEARGRDYLALRDRHGYRIHSDLFLAYDSFTGQLWTLDGSTGGDSVHEGRSIPRKGKNEVSILEHSFTTTSSGVTFGPVGASARLERAMLE